MSDFEFDLRLFLFRISQFFHSLFHKPIMGNALAGRIRTLTTDKIDFANDEVEAVVDGIVTASLTLDDAADAFTVLAGEDVDQEEIAGALVDLADIFDDANLTPEQRTKLDGVVNSLLKSGTTEQREAAKVLFAAALDFGLAAKAANAYFDAPVGE